MNATNAARNEFVDVAGELQADPLSRRSLKARRTRRRAAVQGPVSPSSACPSIESFFANDAERKLSHLSSGCSVQSFTLDACACQFAADRVVAFRALLQATKARGIENFRLELCVVCKVAAAKGCFDEVEEASRGIGMVQMLVAFERKKQTKKSS